MVSPPPHRRQRKQGRNNTSAPRIPPQPPRWTTLGHSISPLLPFIQIELTSDTPNTLTLAYTYEKPGIHQRHLVRLGEIRPHHFAFDLGNVFFLNQLQPSDNTQHTFELPLKNGCHNVYYAAFDGFVPSQAHSISPIFALTYCAAIGPPITGSAWDNHGGYPDPAIGDVLHLSTEIPGSTLPPPLQAIRGVITPVFPEQVTAAQVYNVNPPFNYLFSFYNVQAIWLVRVTGVPIIFNRSVAGFRYRNVPLAGNPVAWATQTFPNSHYGPGPPSRWGGSMLVGAQPEEQTAYNTTNNSQADVDSTDPNTIPYLGAPIDGAFEHFTFSGNRSVNTDGAYTFNFVRFHPGISALNSYEDISRIWRHLPNLQTS